MMLYRITTVKYDVFRLLYGMIIFFVLLLRAGTANKNDNRWLVITLYIKCVSSVDEVYEAWEVQNTRSINCKTITTTDKLYYNYVYNMILYRTCTRRTYSYYAGYLLYIYFIETSYSVTTILCVSKPYERNTIVLKIIIFKNLS